MSGIRVGTRLEQLYQLRAKRRGPDVVGRRLDQLGLTARQVKEWAVAAGLIERVCRGRVSHDLVESYAAAHQPPSQWAS